MKKETSVKNWKKYLLILVNIIYLGLILPSVAIVPMSAMIFDAPGSEDDNGIWIIFLATITFPVALIISSILSFVFWKRKKEKSAYLVLALPIINIATVIITFWVIGKM